MHGCDSPIHIFKEFVHTSIMLCIALMLYMHVSIPPFHAVVHSLFIDYSTIGINALRDMYT